MNKKYFLIVWMLFNLPSLSFAADLKQSQNDIIKLIKSGQIESAKISTEKLVTDYSKDSSLPEALYWVGRNFGWSNRYDEEKSTYQRLIQNYPDNFYSNKAKLGLARADILSLIGARRFSDAKTAFDRLTSDFSTHPDFPDALNWIAQKYGYAGKSEEEKNLYHQIIEKYPDSSFANKAKLGYSSAQVRLFIQTQNYELAEDALNKMIKDFDEQPDLPDVLYRLARGYEWQDKYEKARDIFERIIQYYPISDKADKARLGISRTTICSLITSAQLQAAQDEIDKMVEDFQSNPDLRDTLNYIGQKYEWLNRYDEAKNIYKLLSDNTQSGKAMSDIERTNTCTKITMQMDKGDKQEVEYAVEQMITAYADRAELSSKLLWVAEQYEQHHQLNEAKEIYIGIVTDFPDKYEGRDSVWHSIRVAYEIEEKREIKGIVDEVINRLREQLQSTAQLSHALLRLGGMYYIQGLSKEQNGNIEAAHYFKKALCIYERIIQEFPSYKGITRARYFSGDCYLHLGQCEKASVYFDNVLSNDPNYIEAVSLRKERCKNKI